jgi:hypothetical protein
MPDRPTKITFAEMREMGVRGVLVRRASATEVPWGLLLVN